MERRTGAVSLTSTKSHKYVNINLVVILGHSKLHFCFWSWIFQRTMRAGATSTSQPPIQVNERWSFIVKMLIKMFAHVLYMGYVNY